MELLIASIPSRATTLYLEQLLSVLLVAAGINRLMAPTPLTKMDWLLETSTGSAVRPQTST